MYRFIWIGPLILIPVVPKTGVFVVTGFTILLDDLVLIAAVVVGGMKAMGDAAITGYTRLILTRTGILFLVLLFYKAIDLGILSLALPWTDFDGIGTGVIFQEGILVLGKTFLFLSVYVLVYNSLNSFTDIKKTLEIFIVSISLVVVVAAIQFLFLGHPIVTSTFRNVHTLGLARRGFPGGSTGLDDPWLDASAVGHEHLGAFMIISIFVIGGLLVHQSVRNSQQRVLVGILWVCCMFVLILCSSRGAWIGALCGGVVAIQFLVRLGLTNKLLKGLVAFGCGWLLLEVFTSVNLVNYLQVRTENLFGLLSGDIRDDSAMNRIRLYGELWGVFLDNPIVGMGPGGAGRIAEGQLIRELVEGGLVGGLLFIAIMVRCGQLAMRSHRMSANPAVRGVSVGFVCAIIGLFGQSFFTELLILTKVSVPFWIIAAVVHRSFELENGRLITR